MQKNTLNFYVDCILGLGFVLSALSGLVFLLPAASVSAHANGVPSFLAIDLLVWDKLHTVSSLVLMAGVVLHLLLHARWIAAMARRMVPSGARTASMPHSERQQRSEALMPRRAFLILTGSALAGLAWVGLSKGQNGSPTPDREDAVVGLEANDATPSPATPQGTLPIGTPVATLPTATDEATLPAPTADPTRAAVTVEATPPVEMAEPTPTVPAQRTACPRGLVNDPAPGRCRLYRDTNHNGYCDLSEIHA